MKLRALFVTALLVVAGSAAMAVDQTISLTVATQSTISINNPSLIFAPTLGTPDSDNTTVLTYDTNDTVAKSITVVATGFGWNTTATPSEYPSLDFVSASTTGSGTGSSTRTALISTADGTPTAGATIVTNITGSGTATVTLEVGITSGTTAGSYDATLSYTIN